MTAKRVTWIAVVGSLVLIAIGLCLCKLRCLKGRKEKKNAERHDIGAYKGSREKLRYTESSVPQNGLMEKGSFDIVHFLNFFISYNLFYLKFGFLTFLVVPRETVVKPLDRYVLNNGRKVGTPKLQNEHEVDVKTMSAVSMHKEDDEIDTTSMDMNFLPPPPPPPFFPVEKISVKPMVPIKVTTTRDPSKGLNTSSVKHFTVALLQQYTNSFSQENFIGEGMLGNVYRAELPDGKVRFF